MASDVDICNMALNRIGISTTIASLTEASQEARACKIWYAAVRDRILQAYPWKFNEYRVMLAPLASTPQNWAWAYAYPNDCLKARYITVVGLKQPRAAQRIRYQISNYQGQKVILSDVQSAELVYSGQVTDPTQFDPLFVSALAALLAAEISLPLSVNPQNAAQAAQAYAREVSNALSVAMSEDQQGPEPDSELVAVRDLFIDGPSSIFPNAVYPGGYSIG